MNSSPRPTVADIHEITSSLPGAVLGGGSSDNPIYTVRGKTFIFFRNPRPDAVDPENGERYTDVIMFHVESEADKQALVEDETSPFFTTPHFNGYRAVLIRASRLAELDRIELAEVIAGAWLARAPKRLAAQWLTDNPNWPAPS